MTKLMTVLALFVTSGVAYADAIRVSQDFKNGRLFVSDSEIKEYVHKCYKSDGHLQLVQSPIASTDVVCEVNALYTEQQYLQYAFGTEEEVKIYPGECLRAIDLEACEREVRNRDYK